MKKKPFVTKEQLENIRHRFISTMRKESVKMQRQSKRHFPGIRDSVNILR